MRHRRDVKMSGNRTRIRHRREKQPLGLAPFIASGLIVGGTLGGLLVSGATSHIGRSFDDAADPGLVTKNVETEQPGPIITTVPDGTKKQTDPEAGRRTGEGKPSGRSIDIPSLDIHAKVVPIAFQGSALYPPSDISQAGFWEDDAPLSATSGTTLIAGHVSRSLAEHGVFWSLKDIKKGAEVKLSYTLADVPMTSAFRVVSVKRYDKQELPADIFETTSKRRLVLVTCTKLERYSSGGYHFVDNLVVVAEPVHPVAETSEIPAIP
jgi:LPXTG-site transpeptidase (sortase) family protein